MNDKFIGVLNAENMVSALSAILSAKYKCKVTGRLDDEKETEEVKSAQTA